MDDEIDLRLYAQILWRARYVILGVTFLAAALAFVVSRFVLPPVYEAGTLLVVEMPEPSPTQPGASVAPARAVALTPAGYKEIADSEAFQALLREKLSESPGAGAKAEVKITARVVGQTNLLELTAEAPTAELAARWANEAAAMLLQEVERLNASRRERALSPLEGLIRQSRQTLDEALKRLQAFTERGPSVERLENEQSVKLKLIADYQNRLDAINVSLAAETAKLETLKRQLADEPRTIALSKALSPEAAAMAQALQGLGTQDARPLVSLRDEQVNPVYVELKKEVALRQATVASLQAERDRVEAALRRLTGELQALTAELVRAKAELQELSWQADSARRNYETAVAQYEAQKAALAGRLGESTLTLVRQAVPPTSPSRPKALLNTVVAGFLGLMVSIFGVFLAELWKQPVSGQVQVPASSPAGGGR